MDLFKPLYVRVICAVYECGSRVKMFSGSAADQVTIVRKNHRKGAFGLFGHAEAGFVSLTVIAVKVLQQVQ